MEQPEQWPKWVVKRPFVGIEYELLDSKVWADLSNAAKVLYLQIVRTWDKRNGNKCPYHIPFGYKDAKHLMKKRIYMAARQELLNCGLIVCLEQPGRNRKGIYALNRCAWDKSIAIFD